jgi:C-terminal processing protease CtpA/Prc
MNPVRRWLPAAACLLILAATVQLRVAGAQVPPPASVSRADATADLTALFDAIERIHPLPYFNRSRDLVAADRRQLIDKLPETVTRAQWWMRLSPIVASLGDGHTEVSPPVDLIGQIAAASRDGKPASQREVLERVRLFPSRSVAVDGNGHVIIASAGLADGIRRGDRLLSINGLDADRLLSELISETSGDSDANRAAAAVDRLTDLLSVHSIVSPYRLTVAGPDGVERTASIEGTTLKSLIDARRWRSSNFQYRVLQPGVGYMDFFSMGGDYGRFKEALAAMFRQVAAGNIRTLIVDLRKNQGGSEPFLDELLQYLTRAPYRTWSRMEIKRSEEVRAQTPAGPLRWAPFKYIVPDARALYTGQPGTLATQTQTSLTTPRRAEPFFPGPVCVLTGPRTFSAGVLLADAIKTFRLATIVGEETGGRANMTMQPVLYTLPRSKLVVSIAAGRIVRANGDADDHSGVIPDILVETTSADIRDRRDPVLDRARDCPRLP